MTWQENAIEHLKPAYDVLPQEFIGHPLFYSKDEFEIIEGSHFGNYVKFNHETNRKLHARFTEEFPELKKYTLEQFLKAELIWRTRAWKTSTVGEEYHSALVPMIDMVNHSIKNKNCHV